MVLALGLGRGVRTSQILLGHQDSEIGIIGSGKLEKYGVLAGCTSIGRIKQGKNIREPRGIGEWLDDKPPVMVIAALVC